MDEEALAIADLDPGFATYQVKKYMHARVLHTCMLKILQSNFKGIDLASTFEALCLARARIAAVLSAMPPRWPNEAWPQATTTSFDVQRHALANEFHDMQSNFIVLDRAAASP